MNELTTTEKETTMNLLQPRFPHSVGGNPIRFLRIIRENGYGMVANITNRLKKELDVVAECKIGNGHQGIYFFKTEPGDLGHRNLCALLIRKGVGGKFRDWLIAVDAGNDGLAAELSFKAVIGFECDPIEGYEASGWTIK